jgi:hypothetical protein
MCLLQLFTWELESFQEYRMKNSKSTTQKNSNIRATTGIRIRDSIFQYIVYSKVSCSQLNTFIEVPKLILYQFGFQSNKIAGHLSH